jgi:hypothetical protein
VGLQIAFVLVLNKIGNKYTMQKLQCGVIRTFELVVFNLPRGIGALFPNLGGPRGSGALALTEEIFNRG